MKKIRPELLIDTAFRGVNAIAAFWAQTIGGIRTRTKAMNAETPGYGVDVHFAMVTLNDKR